MGWQWIPGPGESPMPSGSPPGAAGIGAAGAGIGAGASPAGMQDMYGGMPMPHQTTPEEFFKSALQFVLGGRGATPAPADAARNPATGLTSPDVWNAAFPRPTPVATPQSTPEDRRRSMASLY